jgi:hypothetical protein
MYLSQPMMRLISPVDQFGQTRHPFTGRAQVAMVLRCIAVSQATRMIDATPGELLCYSVCSRSGEVHRNRGVLGPSLVRLEVRMAVNIVGRALARVPVGLSAEGPVKGNIRSSDASAASSAAYRALSGRPDPGSS